jgi:hypothetical protein
VRARRLPLSATGSGPGLGDASDSEPRVGGNGGWPGTLWPRATGSSLGTGSAPTGSGPASLSGPGGPGGALRPDFTGTGNLNLKAKLKPDYPRLPVADGPRGRQAGPPQPQ